MLFVYVYIYVCVCVCVVCLEDTMLLLFKNRKSKKFGK